MSYEKVTQYNYNYQIFLIIVRSTIIIIHIIMRRGASTWTPTRIATDTHGAKAQVPRAEAVSAAAHSASLTET